MTEPPPESKRGQLHAEQTETGDGDAWRTFALGGAIAYGLACCLILPFAFGSWAAFTAAAVLGAPVWLLILLGGVGLAAGAAYAGTRSPA